MRVCFWHRPVYHLRIEGIVCYCSAMCVSIKNACRNSTVRKNVGRHPPVEIRRWRRDVLNCLKASARAFALFAIESVYE